MNFISDRTGSTGFSYWVRRFGIDSLTSGRLIFELSGEEKMSSVWLIPRPGNCADILPIVRDLSLGVTIGIVWAVSSDVKIVDLTTIHDSSQRPLSSSLVVPFVVDSITGWVGDPNIMPIVAITTIDVAVFLESDVSNFRDLTNLRLKIELGGERRMSSVWLIPRPSN